MNNKFETASKLNVNDKTEKKGNLTYLSWSWAWAEFKKIYPEANYNIKKFGENNLPYIHDENTGYMVFTEVTADDKTYEMWLPVMDFKNKAMLTPSMFDINKTIMRCLTKNLAMFGLGLYIYAGEDLPEINSNELIDEINKIDNLEELRDFYIKNKGKGKEVEKAITERSQELK